MKPFSEIAYEHETCLEDDEEYRSGQMGVVGYHKAVSESLVLLAREMGVSTEGRKLFFLSLRRQALKMVRQDLNHVKGLGYTDRFCIEIGVRQTCYAVIKRFEKAEMEGNNQSKAQMQGLMQKTLELAEDVQVCPAISCLPRLCD